MFNTSMFLSIYPALEEVSCTIQLTPVYYIVLVCNHLSLKNYRHCGHQGVGLDLEAIALTMKPHDRLRWLQNDSVLRRACAHVKMIGPGGNVRNPICHQV